MVVLDLFFCFTVSETLALVAMLGTYTQKNKKTVEQIW